MKAIHNVVATRLETQQTVVNKAKIQNESNSQLPHFPSKGHSYCCQQSKDTK